MRFVPKALRESSHQVHEVGGLYAYGLQVRYEAAQFGRFVLYRALQAGQRCFGMVGCCRDAAPYDVELDFDAEQSLQNAVVQIARYAGTLRFDRACS